MKLVVDTNVLVAGTLWTGNPSRLLDALLDGAATLCLSTALLAEFEEVIQREKFRSRLEARGGRAKEIIVRFQAVALVVEPPTIPVPSELCDPEDIHVLACAVASGADAIVTGDADLLSIKAFGGSLILSVREALEKLGIPAA